MKTAFKWIMGLLIGALALMMLVARCADPTGEIAADRHRIDFCWEGQSKKSMAPDEQRFVAGVCEEMERKFVEKYHHKP